MIDGVIRKLVILIEDLTTDGGSKIKFCNALRDAGAEVAHTLVIFYYNIFPNISERLRKSGLQLHYLASWWDVLSFCKAEDTKWNDQVLHEIEQFLKEPSEWAKRRI